MNANTVTDRMALALNHAKARWQGRRWAKAFYLSHADWAEFTAVDRPTVEALWGNNPAQLRVDPAFEGVPVRRCTSDRADCSSRLYDSIGRGLVIPSDARAAA